MMGRAGFAYLQARLHARYGRRLSDRDWQHVEASRDLGHCLEAIGNTAIADFVARLDKSSNAHVIEQTLRGEWYGLANEVAHWAPAGWGDPIRWLKFLPHLRPLELLGSGETPPEWLRRDRVFGPLIPGAGEKQRKPHQPKGSLGLFQLAANNAIPVSHTWLGEWKRLLPDNRYLQELNVALDQLFCRYLGYNRDNRPPSKTTAAEELASHLSRTFRKGAQTPVAAFAYLGLAALDFERLRGVLTGRSVFGEPLHESMS